MTLSILLNFLNYTLTAGGFGSTGANTHLFLSLWKWATSSEQS